MQKEALLIGINNYSHFSQLDNCENDASDLSDLLKASGFNVTLLVNATQKDIISSLAKFKKEITQNSISVIYFSGHGLQVEGDNFIVPVDANISITEEIPYFCIHASDLLIEVDKDSQNMHIVILDACRNNPFKSGIKGLSGGLAKMNAPMGTLIAYSTGANMTSIERKEDRNGIYTKYLLESLKIPNLSVEQVFKNTRTNVITETKAKQVPWDESSLHGKDFYFLTSDTADVPFEEVIKIWQASNEEILLPKLIGFLNSEYLINLSVEKLQFLFSLIQIAFEKETLGINKKTVDEDYLSEVMIDEFYPILQKKILEENILGDFELLESIEIINDINYGYNSIEIPEESFPQIFQNEIIFEGLDGILSFFVSNSDNQHLAYPILFLKDSGLLINKFGMIMGENAEKILLQYIKKREPFEKDNGMADFTWDTEIL